MPVLLGLTAALGWGASDYFGGDATRGRTPVLVVVAVAELMGLLLLAPVLAARGTPPPANPALLLAALAGVTVTIELRLVYRALSRDLAFITAPVGALGAAGACAIGLLGGDPLSLIASVGLVTALLGGGMSAWTSSVPGTGGAAEPKQAALICGSAAAAVATSLTALHAAG
ncbi:MAG: hypothetical protein JO244_08240, partial [Solirubrobacterales bacterium]|nr:hypothetical protein [Solirubrobacterales bacterium]